MGMWGNFMIKFQAGMAAFNQPGLISQPELHDAEYDTWENRKIRYSIGFNLYQSTLYNNETVLGYTKKYFAHLGLYRYTRSIYNPSWRIVEFWRSHIWGGLINWTDLENSAIPIETKNNAILEPLELIYKWSNWDSKKDTVTLYGSSMGDVGIKVIDDVEHEQVWLHVIHPSHIKKAELDHRGNVKSYTIERQAPDPNDEEKTVIYREECYKNETGEVVFKTFINNTHQSWTNNPEDKTIIKNYGFCPLVIIQHNNIGGNWGQSETQSNWSLFHELNDTVSIRDDYLRRMLDPTWLMTGMNQPKQNKFSKPPLKTPQEVYFQNKQQGRQSDNLIYERNEAAKAQAMVTNLDIASMIEGTEKMLAEIERNYPELALDITGMANIAFHTLEIMRQPVITKVKQRRVGYDDGLTRANKMALTIGGLQGLWPFDKDSFKNGNLDHTINSKRPVFASTPHQVITLSKLRAEVAKIEGEALPLPLIYRKTQLLKEQGLSDSDIKIEIKSIFDAAQQEDGFGNLEERNPEINNVKIDTGNVEIGGGKDTPENVVADDGLNGAQLRAVIDSLLLVNGDSKGQRLPASVVVEFLILETIAPDIAQKMVDETVKAGKLSGLSNNQIKRANPVTKESEEQQERRIKKTKDKSNG